MFTKRSKIAVADQTDLSVEPQIAEKTVYIRDRQPRFIWGLLIGAALLAGGGVLLARQEGSFQTAGASLDRGLSHAQRDGADAGVKATHQLGAAAAASGDAIKTETDKVSN